MTLDELKAKETELLAAEPLDTAALKEVQDQIAQLEQQQATEQRAQAQEEKVQSITLPYDFNDLFDNKNANDTIIEVVQQALRQAYADHNAEIEQVQADCREKLRAAEEREIQLQRQNTDLQQQLEQESGQLATAVSDRDQARKDLQQMTLERDDAIAKRDAATRELEDTKREVDRLNGHIDDLRTDAAVGARNTPTVIQSNDKLDQLFKQSAAEKAARALARFNASNPDVAVPPLEVAPPAPTFPTAQSTDSAVHNGDTQAADASVQPPVIPAPTFQVPSGTGLGESAQGTDGKSDGANVEERLQALESRVAALEQAKAGQAA